MEFISILQHSLSILSWQENLSSDEMPPRWMWELDWELEKHFEMVKTKRNPDYKSPLASKSDDEDKNIFFDEWEKELRRP